MKKVMKFFQLMKVRNSDLLLDAGGATDKGLAEIRNFFEKIIVVDLYMYDLQKASRQHKHVRALMGNVCSMPLGDESVDFVFSNAVIEHIDKEKRYLFAEEVRRVARKGYFITTPNYWFPFEPHYLFPFWQYLPERLRKHINRYFSLKDPYEKIDLLSKSELKNLFPEAKVAGLRIASFIPETLICWYKR